MILSPLVFFPNFQSVQPYAIFAHYHFPGKFFIFFFSEFRLKKAVQVQVPRFSVSSNYAVPTFIKNSYKKFPNDIVGIVFDEFQNSF